MLFAGVGNVTTPKNLFLGAGERVIRPSKYSSPKYYTIFMPKFLK
jgi:hypothetical protein